MTAYFVNSTAGGANTGADWTNAFVLISSASTAAVNGDTVWVGDNHAETTAGSLTLSWAGGSGTPVYVYCVDHTKASPGAGDLKTTGSISTTGASVLNIRGTAYFYGLTFKTGNGASDAAMSLLDGSSGAKMQIYDNCSLQCGSTSNSLNSGIVFGTSNDQGANILLNNTTMVWGAAGQRFLLRNVNVIWKNTASALPATVLTTLIDGTATATGSCGTIVFDGVDLSALTAGHGIIADGNSDQESLLNVSLVNCKIDNSVTRVSPSIRTPDTIRLDLIACSGSAGGYNNERYRYEGTLLTETTDVRSSGASDGSQAVSWKVSTTAAATNAFPFECYPISIWNLTTGSTVTATIELMNDGTTLTNADINFTAEYLGSGSNPLASFASSAPANFLTSPTNITTSAATWTTSGIGAAVKQKMSVSFTPQVVGYVRCVIYVAKANKTIYIDPLVTLS